MSSIINYNRIVLTLCFITSNESATRQFHCCKSQSEPNEVIIGTNYNRARSLDGGLVTRTGEQMNPPYLLRDGTEN